jgi:SAM-dependent methyltransferase
MSNYLAEYLRKPQFARLKKISFFLRGMLFLGRRYRCSCCNWGLRGFVGRSGLFRTNPDGYCPRCNAKARHRRIWLYIVGHQKLFGRKIRLLEVAPWWALSRRFQAADNIDFVGVDLVRTGPHVTTIGDAASLPLQDCSFDTVICIHVLEHVDDDRQVISELYRVLKPGGSAIVSVPLRLDGATLEDPSITDPEERLRLFGETGHVRFYGLDLTDRLTDAGFKVDLDLAKDVPADVCRRFGLRNDENIFHCQKPVHAPG